MSNKSNTKIFIEKAILKHKTPFDYSEVVYKHALEKVCIICPNHGKFWQTPNSHLNGYGCVDCSGRKRKNTKWFIIDAQKVHGNTVDYSKVDYSNAFTKVELLCPIHGSFWQKPNKHLSGDSCPKCGVLKTAETTRYSQEDFIRKAIEKHQNQKLSYEKVSYLNSRIKVIIVCLLHGDFEQTPSAHLIGASCPKCRYSKGERQIELILKNTNAPFKSQVKIPECKNKRALPFDFGIFDNHGKLIKLIEYQGEQHYIPKNHWGGLAALIKTQQHDFIKKEFCIKNNIPLLAISFKNDDRLDKLIYKFVVGE